jgi:hypothetical protein
MAQDSPVEEIIGLPRYTVKANTNYTMSDTTSSKLTGQIKPTPSARSLQKAFAR